MSEPKPFVGFTTSHEMRPLIVVDLGYSERRKSCGLAWTDGDAEDVRFGDAVRRVGDLIEAHKQPILVLEAVLSTFHHPNGCPAIRGAFERGRAWYCGPGAVSALAAKRFLEVLRSALRTKRPVFLAEAFLSNKDRRTRHRDDARRILTRFWHTTPEDVNEGGQPLIDLIAGVPSVRVFEVG
jgi:hypothetical protein